MTQPTTTPASTRRGAWTANRERYLELLGSARARPVRFAVVGGLTFGVQISLLVGLTAAGIPGVIANAIALATAVQFNFLVNHLYVWGDRPLASLSWRPWAERWAAFHGCIAFSLAINFGGFLVARLFLPDVPAAIFGIGASTVIKFVSLDRLAFRVRR